MKAPVALAGAAAAAAVLGAFYDLDSGELTREYVVRVEAGRGATSPLADEKTVAKSSVARAPPRGHVRTTSMVWPGGGGRATDGRTMIVGTNYNFSDTQTTYFHTVLVS
ncbi:hypothetical protein [Corynebacterium appendicis]|uniref:hypothetical protein n=1 Tax=Corynebacterium appendicis TaxID=163202 RepID=UPI0023530050|nr:hypothetical protein [Corynebacterium appendicis]